MSREVPSTRRLRRRCAAGSLALAALGCEPAEAPASDAPAAESAARDERARILGPFLSRHWRLPVPPQGPPPPGFSPLEASLDPADCGACHPLQYAQWRDSPHAVAWSPGLAGQLLEGALAAPASVRQCQRCHAPLAEQQPFDERLARSQDFRPALRAQGIVCAACHVRGHARFGPPARADAPRLVGAAPHGGFEARAEFGESRFCAPCHQFFDDAGVNGKPLENTFHEWRASPQAAQGRSCQSCHMPDRAHLWRGIHDPEMVRGAVDASLELLPAPARRVEGRLVLASRDVGHFFPTYVTARVELAVFQARADGSEIAGTRRVLAIGREVDTGVTPWRERFDTRVAPGASAVLAYGEPRRPGAAALVGRVRVDPDHHYRHAFPRMLARLSGDEARALLEEAQARIESSAYDLAELRRPLP